MRVGSFVLAARFPGQGEGEALHRAVRSAEVAEESGLDTVWLAEHHFVPYGTCPSAVTLAAMLLGRTRRLRVGTAVSVLPTAHPVALGEQAALLHVASGGRFSLGLGRGGPWVDLEVFGAGLEAYEKGFPEALDLLLRWLREPSVGADGERYRFREVPVVPRSSEALNEAEGPEVVVACTSPASVRLAAERGLPMLLGMHVGDEEKAEMVALWRRHARAAGRTSAEIEGAAHVSAGVCQIADRRADAAETLLKAMPGWLKQGLGAHVTVDGRERRMRDPLAYTELLCGLHPVGTRGCAPTGSPRPASGPASPASRCSSRAPGTWRRPRRTYGGSAPRFSPNSPDVPGRSRDACRPATDCTSRVAERQAIDGASAVAQFRRLVEQLAAHRGEAGQLLVDRGVKREHGHPVAVLEGQPHTEVPLQRAAYRVTRERTQQLTACLLVRRRRLVVGEGSAVHLQLGHQGADHLPCVGQGGPDAVDEVSFVDLASLGLFE